MKFRPCIDLHEGQVKQIVGSTLTEEGTSDVSLATNFATTKPAADFAHLYARDALTGGHVIMLGQPGNTGAAMAAIKAYPGHLQVGGGITDGNAREWIAAAASPNGLRSCSTSVAPTNRSR